MILNSLGIVLEQIMTRLGKVHHATWTFSVSAYARKAQSYLPRVRDGSLLLPHSARNALAKNKTVKVTFIIGLDVAVGRGDCHAANDY